MHIIAARGWWRARRILRLRHASMRIPTVPSARRRYASRSCRSRRWSWPTTRWTRVDRWVGGGWEWRPGQGVKGEQEERLEASLLRIYRWRAALSLLINFPKKIVEIGSVYYRYPCTLYALIGSHYFALRTRENSRKIPTYYRAREGTLALSLSLSTLGILGSQNIYE